MTLAIASSGITVRPSFSCGVTSTGSHLMGTWYQGQCFLKVAGRAWLLPTLAAEKISLTDCAISGPMPSPSINVTVYFPCDMNLPISDLLHIRLRQNL